MSEENQMKMAKKYKLLVIDDNEQVVDMLTRFLSQKYDVITAYKGLDGLKALEAHQGNIDLVNNRAIAYYFKKEYDKSWEDVRKAKNLGYQIPIKFLDDLRKASGRQN